MKSKSIMAAAVLGLAVSAWAQSTSQPTLDPAGRPETAAQRDARMTWWREARFGMFVHWGPSSLTGGRWEGKRYDGEALFVMMLAKVPVEKYKAFAAKFNPTEFDAEGLATLAKQAGMKYLVLIAKHHDGFAMWPSKVSDFNIVNHTPYKHDVVGDVAAACRKQDLKFGIYYSQGFDWTHPGGWIWVPGWERWDEAQKGSFDTFVREFSVPQVRELVDNYKPDLLWWDTCWSPMTPEHIAMYREALSHQPGIITNNRLAKDEHGDFGTPEQNVPAKGLEADWETCRTIGEFWGYNSSSEENKWKSSQTLIRELVDVVSKGGNYLLNVGPDSKGLIPQPEIDRLRDMGAWMKVNGQAIYGTTASPFETQLPWGRCTQKPGKLFLHVFDWPQDGKLVVPVANPVSKAYLLADPDKALQTTATKEGVTVDVPAMAPDANASVVVLEIDGPAKAIAK